MVSWHPKLLVKQVLDQLGVTVTRKPRATLRSHLRWITRVLEVDCILDVGAHEGEYRSICRESGFGGPVASFEPTVESFCKLVRNAKGDKAWAGFNIALGASDGEAVFNVFDNSACNSFSSPTPYMTEHFGVSLTEGQQVKVTVRRLDGLMSQIEQRFGPMARVLLKIDTQGHDFSVLEGASGCLDRIVAIQSEVSVRPLYSSSVVLEQALKRFSQLGFELSGMFPATADPCGLLLVELDCLLVRGDRR